MSFHFVTASTETEGGEQEVGVPLPLWRPADRKSIYLAAFIFAVLGYCTSSVFQAIWHAYQQQVQGHPAPYGDFFALWSYAEVLKRFPATELYQNEHLHQLQVSWGMNPASWDPFPYPPLFIPLVKIFDLLPYDLSYVVWDGATLLLLLIAATAAGFRSPWSLLAITLAPFSTLTIGSGQSGFLAAVLILLSLRFASTRPILSGLALGLLAYKPQLAVLLPIAFVAAGAWTALLVAVATVICLCALTSLLFGLDVWTAWIAMLPHYHAAFLASPNIWRRQPTLIATLHGLGFSDGLGTVAQMAELLLSLAVTWRVCRTVPLERAAPALILGWFAAMPHAFYYDMPAAAAAMALFVEDRFHRDGGLSTATVALLTVIMVAPFYLITNTLFLPVFWPCLALMAAVMARAAFRDAVEQPRR